MRRFAAREDGGLWSAATAAKLICFQLPLADAIEAVVEATNLSREEVSIGFVSMSLQEWYSVWSSAVSFSIQYQELLAAENEVLGADVTATKAELAALKAKMAKHEHDYARHALATAIKDAERAVDDEYNRRLQVSQKMMPKGGQLLADKLWHWMYDNSDNYAELIRLRSDYAEKF
ncbi:hypothetical protein [Lacipirellula sp.]|uniref:hypothetical protein n=1 Tax=Lacipirellula sp. TaxID=2691419 RepID=UPI003D0997D4